MSADSKELAMFSNNVTYNNKKNDENPDKENKKLKRKFKKAYNKRFNQLKMLLDSGVEDACRIIKGQKENSSILLKELKALDNLKTNLSRKGTTTKSRFNSFAVLLKKYHRIDGIKAETFWYIEIHSKKHIDCILCSKDKIFDYLTEIDYDSKVIKEQLNIGKRIIAPKTVKKSYDYDWRYSVCTDENVNNLKENVKKVLDDGNAFQAFSVLGYAALSLFMDEIDTKSHKLLIPNIIYDDKTKGFASKIINACYIRTRDSELLSIQSMKLSKDSEPEKLDFDHRPIILYFSGDDDYLLRIKLKKYYSYLETCRQVEFPYNGIPFVLSRKKISNNFLTIDLTKANEENTKIIRKTIQALYHGMFYKEMLFNEVPKLNHPYFENITNQYSDLMQILIKQADKSYGTKESNFTFKHYTKLALLTVCSYAINNFLINEADVNLKLSDLFFDGEKSDQELVTEKINQFMDVKNKENQNKYNNLMTFCNRLNEKLNEFFTAKDCNDNHKTTSSIQTVQNDSDANPILDSRNDRSNITEDKYDTYGILVNVDLKNKNKKDISSQNNNGDKTTIILLGKDYCNAIIKKYDIGDYNYDALKKDALDNGICCYNEKKAKAYKIALNGVQKRYLAFYVTSEGKIHFDNLPPSEQQEQNGNMDSADSE